MFSPVSTNSDPLISTISLPGRFSHFAFWISMLFYTSKQEEEYSLPTSLTEACSFMKTWHLFQPCQTEAIYVYATSIPWFNGSGAESVSLLSPLVSNIYSSFPFHAHLSVEIKASAFAALPLPPDCIFHSWNLLAAGSQFSCPPDFYSSSHGFSSHADVLSYPDTLASPSYFCVFCLFVVCLCLLVFSY